ncbi:hypothetical protein RHMOL_Rhmol08G0280000 [Rhododendron molle]|uniref:Uncharacterized protein n=1 Tax=Rhododendron molle TaxID=49168 RepID=A0ACC0MT64_RHOML|nr:hypothetical protein RHMOL_Rhmol08G0280000 [Rhododendron molle]
MAATAISLQLRPKRQPIANPNFLHFFSSSTPSDSTNADDQNTPPPPPPPQSPFSSYFSDVKASLKQNPPPPPQPQHRQGQSLEEIRKNLSQFHRPSPAPPPHDKSSPAATPPISFQELYRRRSENSTIQASNKGSGGRPSFDAIRESLRQLKINKSDSSNNNNQINYNRDPMSLKTLTQDLNLRPDGPNNVIGGTDQRLPASVFGKEMREKERESPAMRRKFVRGYSYEELGKKLRMLRPPEGKRGEDWFSLGELNERLMKLREVEEKEEKFTGVSFSDLRQSLVKLQLSSEENNKKQMFQRLDILGQLGGTPNFMLSPPKDQLVEKASISSVLQTSCNVLLFIYFHPDNMSSSEKMKLELQKVRDEFKMSESDCGSARVQVAQLTTKIKHLSTALDKKDKHSRKGLQAMVQKRKKLLKYLRRTDWDSYCLVLSKLGLRDNPDFKILTYPKKTA